MNILKWNGAEICPKIKFYHIHHFPLTISHGRENQCLNSELLQVKFYFIDFLVKVKKSTHDFPFLKVILKGKLQGFFSSPFELLIQYGMPP